MPGSPFKVSGNALFVGVDPKGKFAYVPYYNYGTSGPGAVAAFSIAANGALKRVAGSPYAAGTSPSWTTVDPNDKFLYVTNENSNNISAYAIGEKSGALTPVKGSPFKAAGNPYSVIIDPSGKFLYEGNLSSFNVSAYTIDGTSGALTPVKGSPFTTGIYPEDIAVDATGTFVYVADFGTGYFSPGNVFAYRIDKTSGALTRVKGSPFAPGIAHSGVATCKRVGSACEPPLPL